MYAAKDESRKEVAPDKARDWSRFCCGVVVAVMASVVRWGRVVVVNEGE